MENGLHDEYLTYNGMNRPVLFRGIPLIPFIICLFLLLLTFFTGVLTIGTKGLFLPVLIIAFMIALKQRCAIDPNAGRVDAMNFKGFALKGFSNNTILKVR